MNAISNFQTMCRESKKKLKTTGLKSKASQIQFCSLRTNYVI